MGSTSQVEYRPDPQFTRHVDDLFARRSLDELFDAGDAARALLAAPGWPVLSALLNAEIATIDAGLDSGRVLEQADYAVRHGRRGGLKAPEAALRALIDRAESRAEQQRAKHEGDAESSPDGST